MGVLGPVMGGCLGIDEGGEMGVLGAVMGGAWGVRLMGG